MKDKKPPKGQLFGPKPTTGRDPSPVRFKKSVDKYGTVWTLIPSKYSNTKELEVWSSKAGRDEKYYLRQENDTKVDLITVDLGQAYDIIRALSEALYTND